MWHTRTLRRRLRGLHGACTLRYGVVRRGHMSLVVRHDGETASSEVAALLAAHIAQPTCLSDDPLPEKVFQLAQSGAQLLVCVVTCEADGSVSRNVRKLVRELKTRARMQRCHNPGAAELVADETSELRELRCVVIALGRAKCISSAASTKDVVFASGRLLRQLLASAAGATVGAPPSPGLYIRPATTTQNPATGLVVR